MESIIDLIKELKEKSQTFIDQYDDLVIELDQEKKKSKALEEHIEELDKVIIINLSR